MVFLSHNNFDFSDFLINNLKSNRVSTLKSVNKTFNAICNQLEERKQEIIKEIEFTVQIKTHVLTEQLNTFIEKRNHLQKVSSILFC